MPRGFTLLEVIVTLSVVLALGALVMPAVSQRLGGATGEAVSRELRSAVAETRGVAIRESATLRLEIVVDPIDGSLRVVAREFEGDQGAATGPARFIGPILDEPEHAESVGESEDRLVMELPRGTRVSREPPPADGDPAASESEGDLGSGDFDQWTDEAAEGLCLGVLLPTGGAVAGAAVYITLPGSWTLLVSLDAWTGSAVVSRWEPPLPENEWATDDQERVTDGAADAAGRR